MAAADIKERLQEQLVALGGKIAESQAWQKLMERYQSLSPTGQKLSLSGVGALLALLLFLLPWSFFSGSQDSVAEFEDKKRLIRDMFRYSHLASSLPRSPEPVSQAQLRSLIQGILLGTRPALLPEQNLGMDDFDNFIGGGGKSDSLPKSLTQKGVLVKLSRLNLEQIISIGTKLKDIRPTVKLVGMKIQANQPDPHYFDVGFKLVAFDLPGEPAGKTAPGKANGKALGTPKANIKARGE